ACGSACTLDHMTTCENGACVCDAGFGDCNGGTDGCETDLSSDDAHCGACGVSCLGGYACINGSCQEVGCVPECGSGHTCVNGTCVGDGTLRFTVTWSPEGDVDLHVVTPNGKEIDYGNPGPDDGTDYGELDADDTIGTGPENIYWADGNTPPSGTYHVCVNAYESSSRAYTLTVDNNGVMTNYTGTAAADGYDTPCSPTAFTYVTSVTFP
ncbi:MAG: hypothetical protein ACOC1F_02295, partial [Myxococcota bacterium]